MAQVLDGLKSLSAEEALGEAGSVERVEGELAARRIQAAWRAKGARREVEGLRKAEEKRQDAAAALIQKRYKEVKRAKSATVGKAGAPDDYAARPARALSRRVSALRPPSQESLSRPPSRLSTTPRPLSGWTRASPSWAGHRVDGVAGGCACGCRGGGRG